MATTPSAEHKESKRFVWVKLRYDDQPKRIQGTAAREEHGPGSLAVYDGLILVARVTDGVESWWIGSD